MKTTQNCTNCGAALEFDDSEIIDKKYIKCGFCNTMNLIDLDDNSLKSVKNMALHSVKEHKIKKAKENEYKNSKAGKLESTRDGFLIILGGLAFFGFVVAINMIVAIYNATSVKDYAFFSIFLVISLAVAITCVIFAVKKFKQYNNKIEDEKNK